MKTKWHYLLGATAVALALTSCTTTSDHGHGDIDPKAEAILDAMSDKLESAPKLRVTATRTASPGFFVGDTVAESARITAARQLPDKLSSVAKTNLGVREIRYDGKQLMLVDRAAKTHGLVPAPDTLKDTLEAIHQTYGFVPPLGELLVNDPEDVMLEGVRSGKVVGVETVGGRACDRLAFKQKGLDWDLWVGQADQLPYKLRLNYASGTGEPMVMSVTIQDWQLNAPVSASEFAIRPPSGSQKIEFIPLN